MLRSLEFLKTRGVGSQFLKLPQGGDLTITTQLIIDHDIHHDIHQIFTMILVDENGWWLMILPIISHFYQPSTIGWDVGNVDALTTTLLRQGMGFGSASTWCCACHRRKRLIIRGIFAGKVMPFTYENISNMPVAIPEIVYLEPAKTQGGMPRYSLTQESCWKWNTRPRSEQ